MQKYFGITMNELINMFCAIVGELKAINLLADISKVWKT
jgi:hypothetical protein